MIDISQIFKKLNPNLNSEDLNILLQYINGSSDLDDTDYSYNIPQQRYQTPQFNKGGSVPVDASLEGAPEQSVLPQSQGTLMRDRDGKEYYVYGSGQNSRMIPKSVIDNGGGSYYTSGEFDRDVSNGQLYSTPQESRPVVVLKGDKSLSTPSQVETAPSTETKKDFSDAGSFGQAFREAANTLGEGATFTYKGKPYLVSYRNSGRSIGSTNSSKSNSSIVSTKQTTGGSSNSTSTQSKNSTQVQASAQTKAPTQTKTTSPYDATTEEKKYLEDLKRWNSIPWFSRVGRFDDLEENADKGAKILKGKLDYVIKNSSYDKKTGKYTVAGKGNLTSSQARQRMESLSGMKLDVGADVTLDASRRIRSKELGGEIPTFAVGGVSTKFLYDKKDPNDLIDENGNYMYDPLPSRPASVVLPTYNPTVVNPLSFDNVQNPYKVDVYDPVTNSTYSRSYGDDLVSSNDVDETTGVDKNGKRFSIKKNSGTYITQDVADALGSQNSIDYRENQALKEKLDKLQYLSNFGDVLSNDGGMGVEDALYKVGESVAFNPSDDVYTNADGELNKTAKYAGQGFNALRGLASAGKAVMGSARTIMSGVANQTRNDLIMNEYKRRQRNAMINQNSNLVLEDGGPIPFFNDGGYLDFLEEGGDAQQFSDMGPQQYRENIPLEQEMTGEYLQQPPQQAGVQPNAEIESGEYVQHPDGQVQQVVGRSHAQGGERVDLEPTTRVISDKLKLGAKNAKAINDEYNLKVKANDTFATAMDRYTRKIGLSDLNAQQEAYFKKLKKEASTRSEETSELNNQYLSERINNIEQKKALLDGFRSGFSDFVYSLQEGQKKNKSTVETNQESIPQGNYFAFGGAIPKFDNGGGLWDLAKTLDVELTPEALGAFISSNKVNKVPMSYVYAYLKAKSPLNDNLPDTFDKFISTTDLGKRFKFNQSEFDKDLSTLQTDPSKFFISSTPTQDVETNVGVPNGVAKSYEQQVENNNAYNSNSLDATQGGGKWEDGYYKDLIEYAKTQGLDIDKFSDHKSYQQNLDSFLSPQIVKLLKEGEMPLTNKHREILRSNGIKVSNNDINWGSLSEKAKGILNDENLIAGYEDGLAGSRGVRVKKGDMTLEEYEKLNPGKFDKLTDSQGRQIYAQYNDDGTMKRDTDGSIVFYYPSGEKVPVEEAKKVENEQMPMGNYNPTLPKGYRRPNLPDQTPYAPRPMESHMKAQHRFNLVDPVAMSPEDQLTELNRQSDVVQMSLEGLTDTQRAAALMNLGANTQQNAAKIISGVTAANAQNRTQVDQFNAGIMNQEEAARVQDAQNYEQLQYTAKAKTEADYDDYMDKIVENRVMRHRYLTKDRMINDMIENFNVGADGSLQFIPESASLINLGYTPTQISQMSPEERKRITTINKNQVDSKGNSTATSVTSTTTSNKGN